MSVDRSGPKKKNLGAIVFWSLAGAAIGLAFGWAIVGRTVGTMKLTELQGVGAVIGAFAAVGAFCGAAIGARLIRATGWMMFAGAVIGAQLQC